MVVESNYDLDMLLGGNYPDYLKKRISHGIGHLSNADCAEAIARFMHPELRNLFLCHLSGNNNTPELAYASARPWRPWAWSPERCTCACSGAERHRRSLLFKAVFRAL